MSRLQLIQAEVCPFAQRTHMCLLEKNLGFDCVEIDLDDKPGWFDEVSPYSKVPLLKDGNVLIYESTIINEYLNEVFPAPPLLPLAAADRATARTWIDFDNVKFIPAFYRLLLEQNLEKRQQLADQIIEHMKFFEQRGFAAGWRGPYWLGESISLLDLAVYPHFERIAVLENYRNIGIPDSCGRLNDWLSAMRERPSVQTTSHDDDYHVEAYAQYADGSASGSTARDMLVFGHSTGLNNDAAI